MANDIIINSIEKELEEKLYTTGLNFDKEEYAKKKKLTLEKLYELLEKILNKHQDIMHEQILILRLEKNRQFLLEELNELRSKGKSRVHVLRELQAIDIKITEVKNNTPSYNLNFKDGID